MWSDFTGSTTGQARNFGGHGTENTFYFESGASSSGAITIQTARNENGPWATIASTTVSAVNGIAVLQVAGPFLWMRPTVASTGTWQVEAVSFG